MKDFFEDFVPGECVIVGSHDVTTQELIQFASTWDPQPKHTDPISAQESQFKGLIAPGTYTMAISVRLLVASSVHPIAVVAALGWDQVRFQAPVRPGDTLTLSRRCIEARSSESRPEMGIVRNEVIVVNQAGTPVLTFQDSILVFKRSSGNV